MLRKKKKKREMPPEPTIVEKNDQAMRLMVIQDRLSKHTIDTKYNMVEMEMLTAPLQKYEKMCKEREKFDITKPVPYDKHEAYEKKKAEQSNLVPGDKIIDTSL